MEVGLICNKGFEQMHSMGRALQSYLGYALEERLHINTHKYDDPLIPLKRIRGVKKEPMSRGKWLSQCAKKRLKLLLRSF
ncbi:hypothetical protein HpHA243_12070 [Helicobacter pylori]